MSGKKLVVPTRIVEGVDLAEAPLSQVQELFQKLDLSVRAAEPQVIAMRKTADEAEMILADMQFRRGRVAYWLTLRKAKR